MLCEGARKSDPVTQCIFSFDGGGGDDGGDDDRMTMTAEMFRVTPEASHETPLPKRVGADWPL